MKSEHSMTRKSYCPTLLALKSGCWNCRDIVTSVVFLVAGRPFLHFSSINYRTFLLLALKFYFFRSQKSFLFSFIPFDNAFLIFLHSMEFPSFGAFVGFFFMFNFC